MYCVVCDRMQADWVGKCRVCGHACEAHYGEQESQPTDATRHSGDDVLRRHAAVLPATPDSLGRLALAPTPLIDLTGHFDTPARVFAKVEGANPTGSTKDPMAAVAVANLFDRGIREFVFTSTGNSGAAFAWALEAFPEMTATLVVPEGFPSPERVPANLTIAPTRSSYAEAHVDAERLAAARGCHCEEGFFSIGRREGLKVGYLEALLGLPSPPKLIVQAISSGMGMLAVARAVSHTVVGPASPRILGIQQESCAPMVTAFIDGSPTLRPSDVVPRPTGLCVATLLGDPTTSYPDVARVVRASGGALRSVTDEAAMAARAKLEGLGLEVCMASALCCAGFEKHASVGSVAEGDTVLLMLTGARTSTSGRAELALQAGL